VLPPDLSRIPTDPASNQPLKDTARAATGQNLPMGWFRYG
jgi:hypothetical protein